MRVLREATGGRVALGALRQEEAEALVVEDARLRAEVGVLQEEVARVRQQLQAALERIKAREEGKSDRPSFVKPTRPTPSEREGPRKKRAGEHNRCRKRSAPTRIERHVLERCPAAYPAVLQRPTAASPP